MAFKRLSSTYNPKRHCGSPVGKDNQPCLALKGQGTEHPSLGFCVKHDDGTFTKPKPKKVNIYQMAGSQRLERLLEKVRGSGYGAFDIISELEMLRALAIGYIEDHPMMEDEQDIRLAADLLERIIKASVEYRKLQQSEMIHVKFVEYIHARMAEVVVRVIQQLEPNPELDWKEQAVELIQKRWGGIQVDTSPKELKRMFEASSQVEQAEFNREMNEVEGD